MPPRSIRFALARREALDVTSNAQKLLISKKPSNDKMRKFGCTVKDWDAFIGSFNFIRRRIRKVELECEFTEYMKWATHQAKVQRGLPQGMISVSREEIERCSFVNSAEETDSE